MTRLRSTNVLRYTRLHKLRSSVDAPPISASFHKQRPHCVIVGPENLNTYNIVLQKSASDHSTSARERSARFETPSTLSPLKPETQLTLHSPCTGRSTAQHGKTQGQRLSEAEARPPAMRALSDTAEELQTPQRTKLMSPLQTPGTGRRSCKLPVLATGNDALLGARLGIYSVADAMVHKVT